MSFFIASASSFLAQSKPRLFQKLGFLKPTTLGVLPQQTLLLIDIEEYLPEDSF